MILPDRKNGLFAKTYIIVLANQPTVHSGGEGRGEGMRSMGLPRLFDKVILSPLQKVIGHLMVKYIHLNNLFGKIQIIYKLIGVIS